MIFKKKSFLAVATMFVASMMLFMVGCSEDETPITGNKFTVSFESNGGSLVSPREVNENALVVRPADPTKDGYRLAGWYKEAGLNNAWNFSSDRVTGDITLYARWVEVVEAFGIWGLNVYGPATIENFYVGDVNSRRQAAWTSKLAQNPTGEATSDPDAWPGAFGRISFDIEGRELSLQATDQILIEYHAEFFHVLQLTNNATSGIQAEAPFRAILPATNPDGIETLRTLTFDVSSAAPASELWVDADGNWTDGYNITAEEAVSGYHFRLPEWVRWTWPNAENRYTLNAANVIAFEIGILSADMPREGSIVITKLEIIRASGNINLLGDDEIENDD